MSNDYCFSEALAQYFRPAPDAPEVPIPKRKSLKWSGPTLNEISRRHKDGRDNGGPSWEIRRLWDELGSCRGTPLITLNLPWDQLLTGKWKTPIRRWSVQALVHLVVSRRIGRKVRNDGFRPIPYRAFTDFLGKRLGQETLNAARDMGIVECDNAYQVGRRCNGYRLTGIARSYGFTIIPAPQPVSEAIAKDCRRRRMLAARDPNHRQLQATLATVTLGPGFADALAARAKDATDLEREITILYAADGIRRGNWWFATDEKTGRVFHNVSSLPEALRAHLLINGQPVGEADTASSQPYLLACLAYAGDDSEEAREFRRLVTSEQFYEVLARWIGRSGEPRENIKKRVLTELFFGRNEYRKELWAALESRFPKLTAFIHRVKLKDYTALAIMLQAKEASLMIGKVVPALHEQGISPLTIHDGVLVPLSQVGIARQVVTEVLERETGVRPLVRVKKRLLDTVQERVA